MRYPCKILATFTAVVALVGIAQAEDFPSRPVHFLVPYAPGGVGDITARLVAQKMTENIGQTVLVEDRPGAGGIIAAEAALKASDGYTVLLTGNGYAISQSLFKSSPHDMLRDFAQISTIGFFDLAMVADVKSPFSTVADVLAYAKRNPGRLTIGTVAVGSTQNLAAQLFKSMAGIDALVVPYKSSADVVSALRSGDIQISFEILAPVIPQFRSKALQPLAIASKKRFSGLPNIPTLDESGVPGYEATSWNGMSVNAKAPWAIIERLSKEVNAAVSDAGVQRKMLELGVTPGGSTPEEMRSRMAADIAKWRTVIERANIPRQ